VNQTTNEVVAAETLLVMRQGKFSDQAAQRPATLKGKVASAAKNGLVGGEGVGTVSAPRIQHRNGRNKSLGLAMRVLQSSYQRKLCTADRSMSKASS
jgi:hypothetical protein